MTDYIRSSVGKILSIELDSPPSYVYTNGEIISGRVTLRSSSDEDVYSIILHLTGIGTSYVGLVGRNSPDLSLPDQWEGLIFLNTHQELYQGNYKLRKGVTYEWPFKMRFPNSSSLLPSGSHGKHQMMSNGDTEIIYGLKASRATSPEQAKALAKIAIDGQGAGMRSKLRSLTASAVSTSLNFLPSRPSYISPELTPAREIWKLPTHSVGEQEFTSNKFSLKSIFKSSPSVDFTVRVDLPKNFVQYGRLPAFIRIIPESLDGSNPGPVTVKKVEFVLSMRVRHKASGYVGENLHQLTVLKIDRPDITINDSGKYDIGGQYSTKEPMWPTFNSSIVETRHNLRAHIKLEAAGKKFEDIFPLLNCKVYPNRVIPSPLNKDYICNIFADDNGDENSRQCAIEAFLAMSPALTEKNVYPQIVPPLDSSAMLALLLPGQHHDQANLRRTTSESSTLIGSLAIPETGPEDQRWISSIFKDRSTLRATASPSSIHGGFAYRYGGEKSPLHARLEFSEVPVTSSAVPPPSYSGGLSSLPISEHLTLPSIFDHVLQGIASSDPSSAELHDSNALLLANLQHLCQEYGSQIRPTSSAISVPDAQHAVAKYPELRKLLVDLAGMESSIFGEEEEDEPKPKMLTKEEAKRAKRVEMANKVGYWSPKAQKREQIFSSN